MHVADMLGKMGELLSDPESLTQLQELAQMLQQEDTENTSHPSESDAKDGGGGGFDMGMLLRVQELMGAMQNHDADAQLLLALRPHLKEKRQKKVDQAVKLLKLLALLSAVKENGMLKDLL